MFVPPVLSSTFPSGVSEDGRPSAAPKTVMTWLCYGIWPMFSVTLDVPVISPRSMFWRPGP